MPRKKLPPELRPPTGRPQVHPWDRWLDGREHTLLPGVDFDCSVASMRTYLYARSRQEGKQITVRTAGAGLTVRATGPRTGRRRHDWDHLLDGEIHSLAARQHFQGKPENFQSYIHARARKRGIRVKTRIMSDHVIIQALPKDS